MLAGNRQRGPATSFESAPRVTNTCSDGAHSRPRDLGGEILKTRQASTHTPSNRCDIGNWAHAYRSGVVRCSFENDAFPHFSIDAETSLTLLLPSARSMTPILPIAAVVPVK